MVIGLSGVPLGIRLYKWETKSDDRTDQIGEQVLLLIYHKIYNFQEKKNIKIWKKGNICIKKLEKFLWRR